MVARRVLPLLLVAATSMACAGTPAASPPASPVIAPRRSAPEPAQAPPLQVPPAGRVLSLGGGRPEGMVADPVTGLVAVALRDPDRVALVVPATGVVRIAPVNGAARHLELAVGGGALLLPGEDSDLLTRYALPSLSAGPAVHVGRQPHDVAATTDGLDYVADEFGGAVSVLQADRVLATLGGLLQPGGAAGDGDLAAVVDVRSRFTSFYRAGRQVARLYAGEGPTHALSLGAAGVLVTDTTGGRLYRFSLDPAPRQLQELALPGQPYGTAFDARRGRVFITATGRNLLVQLAVTPAGLTVVHTYPTVRNAYSVAVDAASGRVLVASETDSTLDLIDPSP